MSSAYVIKSDMESSFPVDALAGKKEGVAAEECVTHLPGMEAGEGAWWWEP